MTPTHHAKKVPTACSVWATWPCRGEGWKQPYGWSSRHATMTWICFLMPLGRMRQGLPRRSAGRLLLRLLRSIARGQRGGVDGCEQGAPTCRSAWRSGRHGSGHLRRLPAVSPTVSATEPAGVERVDQPISVDYRTDAGTVLDCDLYLEFRDVTADQRVSLNALSKDSMWQRLWAEGLQLPTGKPRGTRRSRAAVGRPRRRAGARRLYAPSQV